MSVVNSLVRLLLFISALGNGSSLVCAVTAVVPVVQPVAQGALTLVPLPGVQTPAASGVPASTTTPDSSKPGGSAAPAPMIAPTPAPVTPVSSVVVQPAGVPLITPTTQGSDFEKLKTTIDELKKKSDEVRNQQKGIDGLEDTMREAIKKMSDKINELSKELTTAHAARPDIITSENDDKAQEGLATIKTIYETVAQAIKDLESDVAKAVTGQAEKIRKEMSTVDEGTKKLQEQAALIQQTIEDIAKKQSSVAVKEVKKAEVEVKAPVQQALPAPQVPVKDEKKEAAPTSSWFMAPVRMISWFMHAAVDFVKTLFASFRTAAPTPARVVDVPAQVEKQLAQAIEPVKPAGVQQPAPAVSSTQVTSTAPAGVVPTAAVTTSPAHIIPSKPAEKLAEDRSIGDMVIDLIAALVTKIQKMIAEVFPSAPVVPQETTVVVSQPVEPRAPVMAVEVPARRPVAPVVQAAPVAQQKAEAPAPQAHEEKKADVKQEEPAKKPEEAKKETPAPEAAVDKSEEKSSEKKPADEKKEEDSDDKSDDVKDEKSDERASEKSDEVTEEPSEGNEEEKKTEE